MDKIKYCPICKKDLPNPFFLPEAFIRCDSPEEHKDHFVDTGISDEEFEKMNGYLADDVGYIWAMIELKKKDPIEYQLKLSQFDVVTKQQKEIEKERKQINIPKCPTCGSTNVNKISMLRRSASIGWFGLGSNKLNKSMECKNCGYTW